MFMPTTPETAPTIAEQAQDDDTYIRHPPQPARVAILRSQSVRRLRPLDSGVRGTPPLGMMIAEAPIAKLWRGLAVKAVVRRAHG